MEDMVLHRKFSHMSKQSQGLRFVELCFVVKLGCRLHQAHRRHAK